MKKVIIYSLIPIVIFLGKCNNKTNKNTNINFRPIVTSKNGMTCFYIGKYNEDTIKIKVENQQLRLDDGFIKEDSVYMFPMVFLGSKLIFKDQDRNSYNFKTKNLKVVHINNNNCYLLLKRIDRLYEDKFFIIQIKNNNISTFSVLSTYFEDIDNDKFIEVGGYGVIEGYCNECDSGYYSPAKIYELNETFRLDSTTSKKMTLDRYDKFLGYDNEYTPVKFTKQYLESHTATNE